MIERYSLPKMQSLWSLENKYQTWLEVEIAICEAWAKENKIPQAELKVIKNEARFDVDRIAEIEKTTKHDVIAFLTSIEEKIGAASRFIHLGCTSSDIVDTANALLLKRAGEIILADFDKLLEALKKLSLANQGLLTIGRTHGIHAEPTSFALKIANFYAEFERAKRRFSIAVDEIAVGKLSGAVGTYALLPMHVEANALEILGLKPDTISTQVIQRDRYAQYFTALAIAAGSIERLCVELRHLQRTELREAEEGFTQGQKGSSAMPHKKNPISAENMTGLARIIRTNSLAAMENQALWHERDISHSSVERIIMPDSTILMNYVLNRLTNLITNLKVMPENIERNLNMSYGLYFSQRLLTALIAKEYPRQKAYELVQGVAMQAWNFGQDFKSLVQQNKEICEHLGKEELETIFDNDFYLKNESKILDRVFSEK